LEGDSGLLKTIVGRTNMSTARLPLPNVDLV
jgi:hypothetical protein